MFLVNTSVYSTGEIPHMRCTFTSYEVLRSRNSNSTKKKSNVQSVQKGRLSFHFSFNFTKPFLSGSKQFWRTKILDKCQGDFVCLYDQNYALVIVTQPKILNNNGTFLNNIHVNNVYRGYQDHIQDHWFRINSLQTQNKKISNLST